MRERKMTLIETYPSLEAAPVADLHVESVLTTVLDVPLNHVLGTSADVVRRAPILLVDLTTREGAVGRAYLFCYRPSAARAIALLVEDAVATIAGEKVDPCGMATRLARRFALLGVAGAARMALSAIDVALWDLAATDAGLPLARLLGGSLAPLPAYNSNGLGLMGADAVADEAEALRARGFRAMKLRLGYGTMAMDIEVTRAVRRRLPDDIALMVDYNQALAPDEAHRRCPALEGEGIAWIEEPMAHHDWAAHAALARDLVLPVQLGENFNGVHELSGALDAGACDLVMPDLARIGGVTGWMAAARVAAVARVPMSSHLMPEVSGHLLAATPTRHWVEHVDWADAFLAEPFPVIDGRLHLPDRPGNGLAWDRDAVERLRVGH
jgi:mandelate racemase